MSPTPRRIPVFVVLPAHTLLLDVAGPIEVLRKANQLQNEVAFDVRFVGALPEVTSSIGLRLSGIEPLPAHVPDGAMVVLSGDTDAVLGAERLEEVERYRAGSDRVVEWLRTAIRPGMRLVSICSGALLAARAWLARRQGLHHALHRLHPVGRTRPDGARAGQPALCRGR